MNPVFQKRAEQIALLPMKRSTSGNSDDRSFLKALVEIWSYRELLGMLSAREIRAKYKNSALGIAWSLAMPLIQLAIYYIAIGKFLGAARSVPDFAIFVFTGLTIWSLYAELISGGTTSIVANSGIVRKVYLPRELFPLASGAMALFNFAVQYSVLLIATLVFGHPPRLDNLMYGILALLIVLIFGFAFGLLLAGVNVYLRDVEHLISVLLLVLFWASPIVYSISFVHQALQGNWIEQLYLANPMTISVIGMQKFMWSAGSELTSQYWPDFMLGRMLVMLLVAVIVLFVSQRIFTRLQGNFAQVV